MKVTKEYFLHEDLTKKGQIFVDAVLDHTYGIV